MTRMLSSNSETVDAVCECGWIFDGPEPGECPACALGIGMQIEDEGDTDV